MAKKKQAQKAKEHVRIRFKELANGSQSIYLDTYKDGKRSYEFLKMYIVPEVDEVTKQQNQNTLQAATAIKSQRIIDLSNDEAGISKASQRSKMLLIDWMRHYSDRKRKTGQSDQFSKQIDKAIKHLIAYRGDKVTLREVDKAYCLGFIDYLNTEAKGKTGEPMAKVTKAGYFRCLNCGLNLAVQEDVLPFNPITKISQDQRIKVPESTREFLTVEEVKKLIATPCKSEATKQSYLFSCFCGLRYSDIVALKWSDVSVDGEQYRVKVVMKKTQKPLYLPLSKEALRWMPERNGAKDGDRVFVLPTEAYLNRLLKVWAIESGINKVVTFHTARHTFATLELTAGADVLTVSKLLGHTQVKTTQIYTKVIDKVKDEAVNKVSNLFK